MNPLILIIVWPLIWNTVIGPMPKPDPTPKAKPTPVSHSRGIPTPIPTPRPTPTPLPTPTPPNILIKLVCPAGNPTPATSRLTPFSNLPNKIMSPFESAFPIPDVTCPNGQVQYGTSEALAIPDSPEKTVEKPHCTCGFDADGWRAEDYAKIKEGDEMDYYATGKWTKAKYPEYMMNCKFRTRRHLPDCPCIVKSPLRTEENGSHIKGKKEEDAPKLDLSEEISALVPIPVRGFGAIQQALQKIQDHANGRGEIMTTETDYTKARDENTRLRELLDRLFTDGISCLEIHQIRAEYNQLTKQ